MASLFGKPAVQPSNVVGDLAKDIQLASPPEDSISALSWSPVANHLAVSSWDNKVRIYDVTNTPTGNGVAAIDFTGPVLSCDWAKDGQKVVGAGSDKTAKLLDLGSGAPAQQVAAHDAPIRSVRFVDIPNSSSPMIVTGSWDKTVKYWDLRSPSAVASIPCQDRVYSMDVKDKLLVIATAERHVNVVNLEDPGKIFKTMQSPLKHQTRAVSCFKEANGFMIGSIEGRCAFQYINEKESSLNMSFKCHRDPAVNNTVAIWTINAISTHPVFGTFSTAGSDGTFNFWDKDARCRLKGYPTVGGSISASAFNRDGTIFSYAVSYDWHKGYATNNPQYPNKIMLHPVVEEEVKQKQSVKKR